MARLTTGLKSDKTTTFTVDNQSSIELPKDTIETIEKIIKFLPSEHLIGIEKVKLVDFIKTSDLKLTAPIKGDLPGLYHQKMANAKAYLEISAGALLQPTESFSKRWMAKTSFKGNIRV